MERTQGDIVTSYPTRTKQSEQTKKKNISRSCAVAQGERVHVSKTRGVAPTMELKVWVEGGPQRVVCGVTDATTCQDVVYALAHATAQSGRFALVERWRHSERALAPSDRPLRLLARRGRAAGDVRFLLRRCPPSVRKAEPTLRKAEPTDGRPLRPPPYDEAVTRSGQRYQPSHQPVHTNKEATPSPPLPGDSPTSKRRLVEAPQQRQQYRDLVRLVSLQRERLRSQQEELAHCDSELSYWEVRLGAEQAAGRAAREELSRLERAYQSSRAELERLQGASEEGRLGRQEERTLCSELTLARSQLAHCEARLLQCQQRLRQLCQEVAEEQRRQVLLEQQAAAAAATAGGDAQRHERDDVPELQSPREDLDEELVAMDAALEERRLLLQRLSQELREANLQALSLADADHKHWLDAGGFSNRPGSTRKIVGSPRQLESAVPTNKNPNGVWV